VAAGKGERSSSRHSVSPGECFLVACRMFYYLEKLGTDNKTRGRNTERKLKSRRSRSRTVQEEVRRRLSPRRRLLHPAPEEGRSAGGRTVLRAAEATEAPGLGGRSLLWREK